MDTAAVDDDRHNELFATTQWSVVIAAGRRVDDGASRAALQSLCQIYWQPVYHFVRRRVGSGEAARDLTQGFFLQLLERETIAVACPERGRFRAFLLTSVKNYLANERHRDRAQKRGGGPQLSLDWAGAESRISWEPADPLTPERRFERQWATTLLARVVDQLREEMAAGGKQRHFEALKSALAGDQDRIPYADVAAALDCSPEAARQAAHRLRKRYRELLRAEVAHTVADIAEVDDEIRRLFAVFGD